MYIKKTVIYLLLPYFDGMQLHFHLILSLFYSFSRAYDYELTQLSIVTSRTLTNIQSAAKSFEDLR